MMKKIVVKNKAISTLLSSFVEFIKSDKIHCVARLKSTYFKRTRKFTYFDLILYLIFRNRKNSEMELINFYSAIGKLEKKISRQAFNTALKKLSPNVFTPLFHKFAELVYASKLNHKFRGYTLLAIDGTFFEIPLNQINISHYGIWQNQHVTDEDDVKKIVAKASGMYDVTNSMFIDFRITRSTVSETPLAFQHLYATKDLLSNQKVIVLADRYYGSAELLVFLSTLNYKFCIRGKSNFYKSYVQNMKTDDEWVNIEIDDKWIKRFRFSPEAIEEISKTHLLRIRIVKHRILYTDEKGKTKIQQLIYFTNLDENEFTKADILALYTKRWPIETSYNIFKSYLEGERFISEDDFPCLCCLYAKAIFLNIQGIVKEEINTQIEACPPIRVVASCSDEIPCGYKTNTKAVIEMLHTSDFLRALYGNQLKTLRKVTKEIITVGAKLKVPIRPDRHNHRWGRILVSGYYYRFSLDGRNFPKIKTIKGGIMCTTAP